MQMPTMRSASSCEVSDHALKNSLLAPNVPAPKQSSGTFSPDRPSCLNSMCLRCPKERIVSSTLPLQAPIGDRRALQKVAAPGLNRARHLSNHLSWRIDYE